MFKELLDKLSISSRDAVIDGSFDSFDQFKDYLNVDRYVDSVLEEIVLSSIKSPESKLILISGNVGDGKSHMLANMYKKFPEEMAMVEVRNDATESNYVSKSWIDELNEFLQPFSDDQLNIPDNKHTLIVAINLGVLSRFLNETSHSFNRLYDFVKTKGILENLAYENHYHDESHFQFLNLADYNLFSLSPNEASSKLLDDLFKKIIQPIDENPFYRSFKEFYLDHPYRDSCVIRFNYLQLSKENVQKGLVNLIIFSIVKFKLIVSIRDLLDFIYDIIVPYEYQTLLSEDIIEKKDYLEYQFLVSRSIYNKLFESEGRSPLLNAIKKLDPLKLRSESLDDLIFEISTIENPLDLFERKKLDFNGFWNDKLDNFDKKELIKTFVRTLYINNINEFNKDLEDFYIFSKYLYAYHTGDSTSLKPVYKNIIKAIQCWNGNAKSENEINIPIGNHQLAYNITQNINISPASIRTAGIKAKVELNEFDTYLILDIKAEDITSSFILDFNLYNLIQRVLKGYRPNKVDREDHIDFQKFVDHITTRASQKQKNIIFERINGKVRKRYQLSYDPAFGYEFNSI
jgi:DNA phosphorothioation-dependent restriction protein DptF